MFYEAVAYRFMQYKRLVEHLLPNCRREDLHSIKEKMMRLKKITGLISSTIIASMLLTTFAFGQNKIIDDTKSTMKIL
jgi:hypothetical protein